MATSAVRTRSLERVEEKGRIGLSFVPVAGRGVSGGGLNVYFQEDITHVLAAVALSRKDLTEGEREVIEAIAAGFGLTVTWRL